VQIFARVESKTLMLPMEDAATKPSADAMDVDVTALAVPTAPTASSTTTTAIAKPNTKMN
jgi:hypothetical protein